MISVVVADTGPLLHLAEASVGSLPALMGKVYAPPSVLAELKRHSPAAAAASSSWLCVTEVEARYRGEASSWSRAGLIDAGEAEAIALCRQLAAHRLLTDDAAARLVAESLGIEVRGSLGIVLWAVGRRHLSKQQGDVALTRLAESSLWLSERVLAEAREALAKMR